MRFTLASFAAASLGLAFGASALAADLGNQAPAPIYTKAPPAPILIWNGFYVGGNAGWIDRDGGQVVGTPIANDGTSGAAFPYAGLAAAGATGNLDRGQGFLGGVQAGYNWQVNPNWVLGLEADFDGASLHGDTNIAALTPAPGFPTFPFASSINANQSLDYFGTLRARVGFVPIGPLMIYGTGGLAYGKPTENVTVNELITPAGGCPACNVGALTIDSSSTRVGWTAGGGLEWMFAPHWSVKAEGLYYDLGTASASGTLIIPNSGGTNFETTGVQYTDHVRGAIARGGINYHF
jgi:outer membrane immunogenic protein